MTTPAFVVGVGMTPFNSPKKSASIATNPDSDYFDLGVEAAVKALLDAGINYDQVDQGIGCYVFGDSTCAQRVFYGLGMTVIPISNVNNYCSSGSTGLWLANQAIRSGTADCVLVVGQDQSFTTNPGSFEDADSGTGTGKPSPGWTPQLYANAQAEYLQKYAPFGAEKRDFANITSINRSHGVRNPYSQLSKELTAEDVLASPTVSGDITRLQCCPSSTGAAAAVIVSERFLKTHPFLKSGAVQVAGQALVTDASSLYESASAIELIGSDMTRKAAAQAYEQAGITAEDATVIELHDCFTTNEMCALEGLGLAKEGMGWKLVRDGGITYTSDGRPSPSGKQWIVNPSGGLISKGHPLGATGLAQLTNTSKTKVWHLRGWAASRSAPGTKYCVQHNMGLGGATVVTIYKRFDNQVAPRLNNIKPEDDGRGRLGYNPAEVARSIRRVDWESVRSRNKGHSAWATSLLPWNQNLGAYENRAKL
ncbi:nonspecific lipid-transfer protein [Colletotrichum asianum]|uniref:propanoyl-CoA C-acyltransferase n=1 Tax=Colletotrichum asianum TaxID=702518 RepID=A0A8H3W779_9PEZI|nr:nonspecific lipid-transfer protein [Colletotrichum asianum]